MLQTYDSAVERYMREIGTITRIPPEREIALSNIIQSGADGDVVDTAVDELVMANLLLVIHCIKRFTGFLRVPEARISYMDLVAEGNVALITAARHFDSSFGRESPPLRFSSYACKIIERRMRRAIKQSRFIHIPEGHFAKWSQVKTLQSQQGESISQRAMRGQLGISTTMLEFVKTSMCSGTSSLEDLHPDEEGLHWSECIPTPEAECITSHVGRRDMRAYLETELEALPKRTQDMIRMRYLQNAQLEDLSLKFGISRERCRQVCDHGLKQLRRRLIKHRDKIGVVVPPESPSKPAQVGPARMGPAWFKCSANMLTDIQVANVNAA